ncbi:MAG: hypothetical protein KatS3mg113_0321 [Planctomycetaceae bacterium]|nr:MAG: hypothetical protein KatS3mg113_0321 [Planctomycetaceae bacterium]
MPRSSRSLGQAAKAPRYMMMKTGRLLQGSLGIHLVVPQLVVILLII